MPINPSLRARQAVLKAAKEVCEGKTGAKSKLVKAKAAALKVAKASIEKAAKLACKAKKAKTTKKAKPKSSATSRKTSARKRK